jgi:signal transduction histidine kinase
MPTRPSRTKVRGAWRGRVRLAAALLALAYLTLLVGTGVSLSRGGDLGLGSQALRFGDAGALVESPQPGGPAEAAGIRGGDLIVALNGRVISGSTDWDLGLGRLQAGQPVALEVRHYPGGMQETIVLEPRPVLAQPPVVADITGLIGAGGLFGGVAIAVALIRPDDIAARLLLLAAGSFGLSQIAAAWGYGQHGELIRVFEPWMFRLACVSGLHLFLRFPAPNPVLLRLQRLGPVFLRRFGGGTLLLYLVPLGAGLALAPTDATGTGLSAAWNAFLTALLAATAVALLYSYVRPPSALAQAQIKWIVWAMTVCAVSFGLWGVVGVLPRWGATALACTFPIAISFAVLRYRLFDVHVVVRATVVWSLLAGLLVAAYLALGYVGGRAAVALVGPAAATDPTISVLAALAVAAVAHPARLWLHGALDRLIYRERVARTAFLALAAERLSRAQPAAVVTHLLTRGALSKLELRGAWLALAPDTRALLEDVQQPASALRQTSLSSFDPTPVLEQLPAESGALLLVPWEDVPAHSRMPNLPIDDGPLAEWYAAGARVLVPLRPSIPPDVLVPISRDPIGIWALGERRSGLLFDRGDLEVYDRVSRQAVVLLDYARLSREQIRRHELVRGELEEEVTRRTRDLAAAVAEIEHKSRQLEVASRHKSEFLANMSHELRTPLNSIIGFSEVLLERMFGALNDKQADYVEDILNSGRHLLSVINDVLDLSKVEAGRMELQVSSFPLRRVLEAGLTMVRERAFRQAMDLCLEVDPAIDCIEADERKVKQVVFNLLSNAVKFTSAGGQVAVRARRMEGSVRVDVCDNGIGIAIEDQNRIFGEFVQAGRPGLTSYEGSGLGLALTRRLVELHGGRIWCDSQPAAGSSFSFTLPLCAGTEPVDNHGDEPGAVAHGYALK